MTRKAVLVGLNAYPNPENRLRGCLNDVRQVSALLAGHFGFTRSAIKVLTDERATTAAIRERLDWLVDGARPGDVLVFHYSGHGSQVPDRHGDERSDGLDEIICPYDLDWDDPFTDDDLNVIFRVIPAGVNLTVILDCCHAGTGLRDLRTFGPDTTIRCLCPPPGLAPGLGDSRPRRLRPFGGRAVEAGAILIAACRDDQVSADAFIDKDYHGALTYYLCRALTGAAFATSYRDLIKSVRRLVREARLDQEPQLEAPPGMERAGVLESLGVVAGRC